MFQFRRFPAYAYLIQRTLTEYCSAGFPHSEISGSKAVCASPKLIAACHVLLRLLMPRHSPCALISLTLVESVLPDSINIMNYAGLRDLSILAHCYCYPSTRTTFAILIEEMLAHPIVPQHFCLIALCCLLTYFQSTLFSFQGADLPTLFKVRLKHSTFLNASIQSRIYISGSLSINAFFAFLLPRKKEAGGPKWTRTTDLTIISRAL